ncbi:hypothetical protein [Catenulispora subtropica]|uniref:hypothetical protein n=1 Tax=Catenulispora subtropica TaxID=450798 RepID=UPI0031E27DA8
MGATTPSGFERALGGPGDALVQERGRRARLRGARFREREDGPEQPGDQVRELGGGLCSQTAAEQVQDLRNGGVLRAARTGAGLHPAVPRNGHGVDAEGAPRPVRRRGRREQIQRQRQRRLHPEAV